MAPSATPVLTRGHKKKARTRAALIEAAIAVIAEQPGGFSIGDVTSQAGVSTGTFYNYFDDRDALISALVPEILTRFAVRSANVVDNADPALRFATVTALALDRAVAAPDEIRAVLRLDAVHDVIIRSPALDHMRADLRAGHDAGIFVVGPDASTLDVVVGAVFVAARRIADEDVAGDYAPAVIAQLLRSLGVASDRATELAEQATRAAGELL